MNIETHDATDAITYGTVDLGCRPAREWGPDALQGHGDDSAPRYSRNDAVGRRVQSLTGSTMLEDASCCSGEE